MENFLTFLSTAAYDNFLLKQLVFIFGVDSASRREELYSLKVKELSRKTEIEET